jgi:hypothetical protein
MKQPLRVSALFTLIALFLVAPLNAAEPFPATVLDISDRAYEPAVKKLLHDAKSSVVISMYAVSLGAPGNNPMRIMLEHLLDAAKRGVRATLYLNTHFRESEKARQNLISNPFLKQLQDAGAIIHIVPSGRKLHDKLIIVDSRYVVEGSTNWSIAALRDNFESSTLIDSPGLAAAKLERLQSIPLVALDKPNTKTEPFYIKDLPATVTLSAALVEDKKYLARMMVTASERTLDLYLILVARAQITGKKEFLVDLETMGLSLGMPRTLSDSRLRQEVIKSLKKLGNLYGLVKTTFVHGRDAKVALVDLPGATFTIPSSLVKPDMDSEKSCLAKYYAIVKAYLAGRGEDIDKMSSPELGRRFHVSHGLFAEARREEGQRQGR